MEILSDLVFMAAALSMILLSCGSIWSSAQKQSTGQKMDAGSLLLSVSLPRWQAWGFGCDLLVVFVVVGSLSVLLAGWVGMAAPEKSTAFSQPFFVIFILFLRLDDRRRIFAPAALEIREHGVVYRDGYWPWEQVKSYSWSDTPAVTLQMKCARSINSYRIAPEQKEEVEALLRKHIRATVDS